VVGRPGLNPPGALERAAGVLSGADRIVVLTGAGVSAESGVPTFRGPGGLWKSHRPEDLATPGAFQRDPALVLEWYAWRRTLVRACTPNEAHQALARLALAAPGRTTLITQNVDGLHQRAARAAAGPADPRPAFPHEVHGAIHRDRCSSCGWIEEHPPDVAAPDLPRCPHCNALMRPDVVWFGEMLDETVLSAAFSAAKAADVCLVVGTSALVYPAASVPEVTRAAGGRVIEVNLEPTPLTPHAEVSLRGEAGRLVPALIASGPWPDPRGV
jgi:NAD-dependent deacetylase